MLKIPSTKLSASLLLIATMFAVALVTVLAKSTLNQVDGFTFVWLQVLFGFIGISLIESVRKTSFNFNQISRAHWVIIITMGICNFTIVKTLFILSLELLPVNTHAYLINFVGIVTMLLSALVLKEKPTIWQLLGALIALFGVHVYFLVVPTGDTLTGVILSILAVVFLAITNILMRKLHINTASKPSSGVVSFIAITSGGLPLVLVGLFNLAPLSSISHYNWWVIGLNGVVSIALTMLVFNYVMQFLRAFEASILASSGLVFVALLSVPILDEVIQTNQLLGMFLLVLGIVFVQVFQRRS
ncbi:DMT family transporter [Aliikangiella sp. IMCC44653]